MWGLINHDFFCFGKQKPFVLLLLFFTGTWNLEIRDVFTFCKKMSDGFTEDLELWTWIC